MAISRNDLESSKKQAEIRSNDVMTQISDSEHKVRKPKRFKLNTNFSGLFSSIILILIAVSLVRILYNGVGTIPTFESLLELLKNAPTVSTYVKNFYQSLQFTQPWAVLDEFRIFLNSISQIIGILNWMALSLWDVIIFIVYFLLWFFV